MTNRIALIAALLTACSDSATTEQDPRAVSCDTFEVAAYKAAFPIRDCTMNVADVQWVPSLGDPTPIVIGGYCGDGCTNSGAIRAGNGPDEYVTDAVIWSGDGGSRQAVAVMVEPLEQNQCVLVACL